ncbi:MAG TPA: argininosuccinate lyase [Candidatus Acidoferrales bacterium]|nr:argininosuccinate lyase [Candidatus Acidoferrales bacterium]
MKKLWQKNTQMLDTFIETFETKDDLLLDQKLIVYDVYGSLAHAKMLKKIGILSAYELKLLTEGLKEILTLTEKNQFILEAGDEDIHTKIENFLIEKYGDIGKKIHTGRSRNDQVLTALRLYSKDKLLAIWEDVMQLTESFQHFANKYESMAMPGFTHMQKAMPSTVGMWASAFTEALLDDLTALKTAYELNDQSPLGSAAGYGVPLPLDRQYTADLMGFARVQINPIYSQNSRGKIETQIIAALSAILIDINKFATDVLFFTSSEINYFSVSENLYSGSSIMPQKKNVDVAELLRSKLHLLLGHYTQIMSLSSNLISGYNRDFQDSKKPFFESLDLTHDSIKATTLLINNLIPNKTKLESSLTSEIFATHQALELVSKGMPFRSAYQKVGNDLQHVEQKNIPELMLQSNHIGGTGNLMLEHFSKMLDTEKKHYQQVLKNFRTAVSVLVTEDIHKTTASIDIKTNFPYNIQNLILSRKN